MNTIAFEGLTCLSFKTKVYYSNLSKDFGIMILEASANPDYYAKNAFPPQNESNKKHLFLPVKKDVSCFQDTVIRAAVNLKKNSSKDQHIFPGQIEIGNKVHQCVHMQIDDLTLFPELLKNLNQHQIKFMANSNVDAYESSMYFKKHIRFKEMLKDVYVDVDNSHRYFFKIDKHIEFDIFCGGIDKIKHNCNYHLFDSFLAHLFKNDEVMDFIGVYSKHCDESRFEELKSNINEVF